MTGAEPSDSNVGELAVAVTVAGVVAGVGPVAPGVVNASLPPPQAVRAAAIKRPRAARNPVLRMCFTWAISKR